MPKFLLRDIGRARRSGFSDFPRRVRPHAGNHDDQTGPRRFHEHRPGALRVAVKLPRAVRPRPHSVALSIGVKLASGQEEFEDFTLREVSKPNDLLDLRQELDADAHIFAYRLDERGRAPQDVSRRPAQEAGGGRRKGRLTHDFGPPRCMSHRRTARACAPRDHLSADDGDCGLCAARARRRSAHIGVPARRHRRARAVR